MSESFPVQTKSPVTTKQEKELEGTNALTGFDEIGVINIAEVLALMRYAAEKGIATNSELLSDMLKDVTNFTQHKRLSDSTSLLSNYSKLCLFTAPVNGRNVVGAQNLWKETKRFTIFSCTIFLLSVFALALVLQIENQVGQSLPYFSERAETILYYVTYFTPFLWGALGSCVYILKRVNDEAASLSFDPLFFKGWITRGVLGAILGGSIAHLISPDVAGISQNLPDASSGTTQGADLLQMVAVAFLAGLGTKAVYGGIEKIIQLFVEKLNLKSIKQQNNSADVITKYLAKEIATTNPKTEAHKYEALVKLLESRS